MTNQEVFDRATIIYDTLTSGSDVKIVCNPKNLEWIARVADLVELHIDDGVEE